MITHRAFYYVRHGQTDCNLKRKLQGTSDIPLNETGVEQAHAAQQILAGTNIGTICCSPLIRARKTADIINEKLQRPIIEIDDLKEISFGSVEGTREPPWLAGYLAGESADIPPQVEPFDIFLSRARTAINEALDHHGPVLIVAHGGTYTPANRTLEASQQWSLLPNCQPVRHDPPEKAGESWQLTCL